jgi:hypothetical protein
MHTYFISYNVVGLSFYFLPPFVNDMTNEIAITYSENYGYKAVCCMLLHIGIGI